MKIKMQHFKMYGTHRSPVFHACNPSYSGGRDQKNQGLKPDWANSSRDPISKNTQHKTGLDECLKW
jgi:hypothetical protein